MFFIQGIVRVYLVASFKFREGEVIMPVRIVVGVNWGDEGKGKMVDYFARQADYVVRFQGGNNAGHTVENEKGSFKMHLIPSGIFYPNVINILGPGMAVNLEALAGEIQSLKERGIKVSPDNLKLSDRAVICFPFHRLQDEYDEERLGSKMFGSTRQGIAQVYADRYLKYGIQMGTLNYPDYLKEQIERCLELKNRLFTEVYKKPAVSPERVLGWAMEQAEILRPYVCDSHNSLREAAQKHSRIILEGQLGALRDIIYGIYPYTTSSSTIASFGPAGAGCFNFETPVITGIMKAFSTCVGEGPFVTEIKGALAEQIRETSFEYGASTGRPRRIGYFDAVASRYGTEINGAKELALTKLDSLSGLSSLKICTHYRTGTKTTADFPITAELVQAEPVYAEVHGWKEDIRGVREYSRLPASARNYVEKLEELVQCRIAYISVGPEREAVIAR
jgi:adenylosuccinate synthase